MRGRWFFFQLAGVSRRMAEDLSMQMPMKAEVMAGFRIVWTVLEFRE